MTGKKGVTFFRVSDDVRKTIVEGFNSGKSVRTIAKETGMSVTGVSKILQKCGLRSIGVAVKNSVNEDFFDVIDTEEKAYWLGFFFADGNISDEKKGCVVQIGLQGRDADHLRRFAKCLGLEDVYIRDRGAKGIEAQICIKNRKLWNGLVAQGVVPRKSLVLKRSLLTGELLRHFWRGYIDGDGTIPVSFRYGKVKDALEMIGSSDICTAFAEYVFAVTGNSVSVRSSGVVYRVGLSGLTAKVMLGHLYNDSSVYLERKKALSDERSIVQGEDGVSLIRAEVANAFMEEYHYLRGIPIGVRCYGWFEDKLLMGVAVIGATSGPNVWMIVPGAKKDEVGELRRFVLAEDAHGKNNASRFLAKVLKLESAVKRYKYIVSYADTAQGHTGTIYKAVGALELGSTGNELVAVDEVGKRYSGRALDALVAGRGVANLKFETSSGKNRFVFTL